MAKDLYDKIHDKMLSVHHSILRKPIKFNLYWMGKRKVKVEAWQEKWGSTINNTVFTTTATKKDMATYHSHFIMNDKKWKEFVEYIDKYL